MVTTASPPSGAPVDPCPHPHPHRVLVATELDSSLEAAAHARQVVRGLLRQSHRADLVETACLLTSELVGNAVVHAGVPVELVVDLDRDGLAIEVIDCSPSSPSHRRPRPMATTGRGLDLVDRLADSWGITPVDPGKSVWFVLGTSARDAPLSGPRARR